MLQLTQLTKEVKQERNQNEYDNRTNTCLKLMTMIKYFHSVLVIGKQFNGTREKGHMYVKWRFRMYTNCHSMILDFRYFSTCHHCTLHEKWNPSHPKQQIICQQSANKKRMEKSTILQFFLSLLIQTGHQHPPFPPWVCWTKTYIHRNSYSSYILRP
jgi:hypothetical protein